MKPPIFFKFLFIFASQSWQLQVLITRTIIHLTIINYRGRWRYTIIICHFITRIQIGFGFVLRSHNKLIACSVCSHYFISLICISFSLVASSQTKRSRLLSVDFHQVSRKPHTKILQLQELVYMRDSEIS